MAFQSFVDLVGPRISAAWLNPVDYFVNSYTHPFNFMPDQAHILDWINGTGLYDHGPYIQQAVNTKLPVILPAGNPQVRTAITCANQGQLISGMGRAATVLTVPATFNLAVLGVFIITSGEPAPTFRDFQVAFVHPDTAVRGSLIAYPPAFYGLAQPRLTLLDMKIVGAMTGISLIGGAGGNSGGLTIQLLEMSAFVKGIDIDGAQDTMRIDKWHHFPFGLTANQQVIFNDSTTTGLNCGRCDDLKLSNCLYIGQSGTAVNLYQSANGNTFGEISTCDFDNYGAFKMSAGIITIASSQFTLAGTPNTQQCVKLTGGFLKLASCEFDAAAVTTTPMVEMSGAGSSANSLVVSGCTFRLTADQIAVKVSASSGTNSADITGTQFSLPSGTSPVNPVVWAASGGRLTFGLNRATDKGAGTGTFVQLDTDDQHMVTSNEFIGWGLTNVNPQIFAVINNNSGVDPWVTSFAPVVTAVAGTFTSVAAAMSYKQLNKTLIFQLLITVTTNGTAATGIVVTLPRPAFTGAVGNYIAAGRENALTGNMLQGNIASGTSQMTIFNYNNTYPGGNGAVLWLTGEYQTA